MTHRRTLDEQLNELLSLPEDHLDDISDLSSDDPLALSDIFDEDGLLDEESGLDFLLADYGRLDDPHDISDAFWTAPTSAKLKTLPDTIGGATTAEPAYSSPLKTQSSLNYGTTVRVSGTDGPDASFTESVSFENTDADDLPQGTLIGGRYEVLRKIGQGGMGLVFVARDTNEMTQRTVAVKLMRGLATAPNRRKGRFVQEIATLCALRHPSIVPMYDAGQDPTHGLYIVMELVAGGSLGDHIKQQGILAPLEAIDIALQVAVGLRFIHGEEIVHRDLKPGNVLLGGGVARLVDFGLSRGNSPADQRERTRRVGTPGYMAPEQMEGTEVDGRADIYSLGVMIYVMLTGKRPLFGMLIDDMPEPILDVAKKCLSRHPKRRYQTADEVIEALQLAQAEIRSAQKVEFRTRCPSCNKKLRAQGKASGGTGTCPKCKSKLRFIEGQRTPIIEERTEVTTYPIAPLRTNGAASHQAPPPRMTAADEEQHRLVIDFLMRLEDSGTDTHKGQEARKTCGSILNVLRYQDPELADYLEPKLRSKKRRYWLIKAAKITGLVILAVGALALILCVAAAASGDDGKQKRR